MSSPFVAEIRIFGFNFAPVGWALCDGQILSISQNTALFSLLGTTYGGNGISTFALPDLQGNVPIHTGGNQPGPGLSTYSLGQMGGVEAVTLLTTEMPAHSHALSASQSDGISTNPAGQQFAQGVGIQIWGTTPPDTQLDPRAVALAGGSLPHNNMQPYLTLNFCIALQGVFPPRQ